jgi:hypothetical protein
VPAGKRLIVEVFSYYVQLQQGQPYVITYGSTANDVGFPVAGEYYLAPVQGSGTVTAVGLPITSVWSDTRQVKLVMEAKQTFSAAAQLTTQASGYQNSVFSFSGVLEDD